MNKNKTWLRLIGDVHGKQTKYLEIANKSVYSIQLGDMGFDYSFIEQNLSSDHHKILGGNHDNYTVENGKFSNQPSHFLGDFGVYSIPEFGDIFYVRGGNSIDKEYRTEGVNWWPLEEITLQQTQEALSFYKKHKPNFVITHECPTDLLDYVGMPKEQALEWGIEPSITAKLLQSMFEFHQPAIWCHGHHHKSMFIKYGSTTFISLGELAYIDFFKNQNSLLKSMHICDGAKKIKLNEMNVLSIN